MQPMTTAELFEMLKQGPIYSPVLPAPLLTKPLLAWLLMRTSDAKARGISVRPDADGVHNSWALVRLSTISMSRSGDGVEVTFHGCCAGGWYPSENIRAPGFGPMHETSPEMLEHERASAAAWLEDGGKMVEGRAALSPPGGRAAHDPYAGLTD